MCKLSVIVPVYNVEEKLERCVQSLLCQDYTDFELILVDDGSTDGSAQLCRKYEESDKRVRYVYQDNAGPSAARNNGIALSRGEYITFADSDDYIDNGAFSFYIETAQKTGADIVLCGYRMENEGSASLIFAPKAVLEGASLKAALKELKSKNLIDTSWNKLYKKDFLEKSGIRYPEGEIFEDTDFNLRLIKKDPKIAVCEECFYHYVLHMGSITRRYNPEKLEIIKRRAELLSEVLTEDAGYCAYYYIKSVISALIDMFLCCPKKEIKETVRKHISEEGFKKAAANATPEGLRSKLIIAAARSGKPAVVYLYIYAFYIFKYKMQRVFLKVRV